ncbi:hypothetical protein AN639_11545 [Candidatus Epulonipiscium fishelsonii]|uniref:Uncharacterized protein n=1 Tax=Candidatus Epulonipiscium fishelsonii TaxID=77094 RepID=A0ACC8X871_9FIRM|nr:hypothetical protein AN396_11465 [Epulopiscium sp. SCG-B11WGA-EpuloA1]ONI43082.1 hypothetical protein AN639_11545 [Epulopiscium sp. SCG-B05WGA-EpuloA1]
MNLNTFINLKENMNGYTQSNKSSSGHIILSMPGRVKLYLDGLKDAKYVCYLLSKSQNKAVRLGELNLPSKNKQTIWKIDVKNMDGNGLLAQDIDGAAIVVEGNTLNDTNIVMVGYAHDSYIVVPLIDKVLPKSNMIKKQSEPIKKDIKKDIHKNLEKYIKKDVKEELKKDIKKDIKKDVKKDIKKEVKEDIKEELKETLKKEEVKENINEELKESIKEELKENTNDIKDTKDIKDINDTNDTKDTKDTKYIKYIKYIKDIKNAKDIKDTNDTKDIEDTKDIKDTTDVKNTTDIKDTNDIKNTNDTKYTNDIKDINDTKNIKDIEDIKRNTTKETNPISKPKNLEVFGISIDDLIPALIPLLEKKIADIIAKSLEENNHLLQKNEVENKVKYILDKKSEQPQPQPTTIINNTIDIKELEDKVKNLYKTLSDTDITKLEKPLAETQLDTTEDKEQNINESKDITTEQNINEKKDVATENNSKNDTETSFNATHKIEDTKSNETDADIIDTLFKNHTTVVPFVNDVEPIEWIEITLSDLNCIPQFGAKWTAPLWVRTAYIKYGSVILGRDKEISQYFIGIPATYSSKDKPNNVERFKPKYTKSFIDGDFGYWIVGSKI